MNIYQEQILDHYKRPQNYGRLKSADRQIELNNPLCGDKISMDIKISKSIVSDIKFSGETCAISTASASLLTEYVKGKKITDLKKMKSSFIFKLLGIELSTSRIKCALLPLEALHKLINDA